MGFFNSFMSFWNCHWEFLERNFDTAIELRCWKCNSNLKKFIGTKLKVKHGDFLKQFKHFFQSFNFTGLNSQTLPIKIHSSLSKMISLITLSLSKSLTENMKTKEINCLIFWRCNCHQMRLKIFDFVGFNF